MARTKKRKVASASELYTVSQMLSLQQHMAEHWAVPSIGSTPEEFYEWTLPFAKVPPLGKKPTTQQPVAIAGSSSTSSQAKATKATTSLKSASLPSPSPSLPKLTSISAPTPSVPKSPAAPSILPAPSHSDTHPAPINAAIARNLQLPPSIPSAPTAAPTPSAAESAPAAASIVHQSQPVPSPATNKPLTSLSSSDPPPSLELETVEKKTEEQRQPDGGVAVKLEFLETLERIREDNVEMTLVGTRDENAEEEREKSVATGVSEKVIMEDVSPLKVADENDRDNEDEEQADEGRSSVSEPPWTEEEDANLLRLFHDEKGVWTNITKNFPCRKGNAVKARYFSFLSRSEVEPDKVEEGPRLGSSLSADAEQISQSELLAEDLEIPISEILDTNILDEKDEPIISTHKSS